jgi:hypothetical protein
MAARSPPHLIERPTIGGMGWHPSTALSAARMSPRVTGTSLPVRLASMRSSATGSARGVEGRPQTPKQHVASTCRGDLRPRGSNASGPIRPGRPAAGCPGYMKGDENEMTRTRSEEELAVPLGSVNTARLVFARGAAHLTIRVDGSMEELYRAWFEGKVPDIRVDGGTVTVKYRPSLRPTRGEITLSSRIPWAIQARWGMSDVEADLEDVQVTGLEISGGASRIEARLPRPKDAVTIRIGGGASNVELIRPTGVPVRVRIGAGPRSWSLTISAWGPPGGRPIGGAQITTRSRAGTTSRSVPGPASSPSEPETATQQAERTVRLRRYKRRRGREPSLVCDVHPLEAPGERGRGAAGQQASDGRTVFSRFAHRSARTA